MADLHFAGGFGVVGVLAGALVALFLQVQIAQQAQGIFAGFSFGQVLHLSDDYHMYPAGELFPEDDILRADANQSFGFLSPVLDAPPLHPHPAVVPRL